jgi:hypothetical protein
MKSEKRFAVRYRDSVGSRRKRSLLRFATAGEAREYADRLLGCGACGVAVVELDGRRCVSSRSVVSRQAGGQS